jgi:hypothetical protein
MATINGAPINMTEDERGVMEKRRQYILEYSPPVWRSANPDPVSGIETEVPMVAKANIVFFGPTGTGKSSLIGSLYRACNETDIFPERITRTIRRPDMDSHGTQHWLETAGNSRGTILYQDTRGDTEYDVQERMQHEFSLRGMYRDNAPLTPTPIYHKDWWITQRFFWERTLNEVPHCVVFVFDGSRDPFLDAESLEFFKKVFEDCTNYGYEPVIVISHLDLICRNAEKEGRNWEIEMHHKKDMVLQAFEDLHLTRKSIYFVTNFHHGQRGGVPLWSPTHPGFDKAKKRMIDLTRDVLSVADRFITRHYGQSRCILL